MGDFVYIFLGHSANRPYTIQLQNRHHFCTAELCWCALKAMTTTAAQLLVPTGCMWPAETQVSQAYA